jgi:hypothetical protein
MAMLGLPTSAAEPEHAPMSGSDRVGGQPRAGGRPRQYRHVSPTREGEAMLTDFYVAFATVCFTLLGLWIIVVQTRHPEWRQSAVHRRRAYGVALHFSPPGLMSLLSLVDPASTALWRISFAVVAAGGVLALVLVRGPAPTGLGGGGVWGRRGPVRPDRPGGGGARHGRRDRRAGPPAAGGGDAAHAPNGRSEDLRCSLGKSRLPGSLLAGIIRC